MTAYKRWTDCLCKCNANFEVIERKTTLKVKCRGNKGYHVFLNDKLFSKNGDFIKIVPREMSY